MNELKIESGRFYKTRDGRKAFVSAEVKPSPFDGTASDYPFNGWIDGEEYETSWTNEGGDFSDGEESRLDLIDEWREPVTRTETIYLFPCGSSFLENQGGQKPIGSARVTLTEGVFAK